MSIKLSSLQIPGGLASVKWIDQSRVSNEFHIVDFISIFCHPLERRTFCACLTWLISTRDLHEIENQNSRTLCGSTVISWPLYCAIDILIFPLFNCMELNAQEFSCSNVLNIGIFKWRWKYKMEIKIESWFFYGFDLLGYNGVVIGHSFLI